MKHFRYSRLARAVHAGLLLAALPIAAQAQQSEDPTQTLDAVQVTGTRIKNAEVASQVPVQTLTREDIERTGLTSVADLIQELTGSGTALNAKFNSSGNFGFPTDGSGVGAGAATVDLRHLGSKRVLILVDGKRWINESSASGVGAATDLNTIPLAIVERIDILEDGASSLYGSDAIAGVVNIITRRKFEGAQVTVDVGEYGEGDGERWGVDAAWGYSSDRLDVFVSASHSEQDPVSSADRPISAIPIQGGSSRVPGGRFFFRDPNTGLVHDLTTNAGLSNPGYTPGQGCVRTDGFHCFAFANDAFNYAPFNFIVTPSERTGVFGQLRFAVNDNVSWYAKALYNRRESTNQAAPEPIDIGPGTGNFYANNVVIPGTNPMNPFGFTLGPNNIITIRRRPLEGGPRIFNQDVRTNYFATGLEGWFTTSGDKDWFWDVNLSHSRNEAEQENFGSYNARRISEALNPAVCATVNGCVLLDIFGFGTMTPAMLAFISPTFHDSSEQTLRQFSANLSGELFDAWGGPVTFATGYEYRKYKGRYDPDPMTVAGEYNGVPSLPTRGSYDVNEFYAEFNVPLYNNESSGSRFDVNIAGRYSDYSTFGGEFTPKFGLRWQVIEDFVLRATFAEGFRAPSIGELFGSQSRFDALIDDPCLRSPDGTQPATGSAANCAALGVPNINTNQVDPQISILTGGNPLLQPEEADSFTAGFVWSPSFAENAAWSDKFDMEVTYYRHEIEGAIQAIDPQTQLNLCVATLDPLFCNGITRVNSQIDQFNNFLTNLGVIDTHGWDVDFFWVFPESDWGKFKLSWQNTFVTEYEAVGAAGQVLPNEPGVQLGDGTSGSAIPEWTSNATLDWSNGSWGASWTARHVSDMTEPCLAADPGIFCSDPSGATNHLGSTTFHDLQVTYKLDWHEGVTITAGVNNIFEKEPPVCTSCLLNGYDPSTYDIPGGRFWYLRFDAKF